MRHGHGHEHEHELSEDVLQYNTIHIHTYSTFFHEINLPVRPSIRLSTTYLFIYLFYTEHIQKEHISHQFKPNIEYLPTYVDTERKKERKNKSFFRPKTLDSREILDRQI